MLSDYAFRFLANKDYAVFYSIAGVAGSIGTYAFGGWSGVLEILLILFVVDYISGIFASIVEGKGLKSIVGFIGLMKKCLILLMVFLAHRIDLAMGMNIIMNGVIYFWIANELVSFLENCVRCGIKTPPVFKKILSIAQERSGDIEEKKNENSEDKK